MYKSKLKERYIPRAFYEDTNEFSYARISKLTRAERLAEGMEGDLQEGLGSALKSVGSGIASVGKGIAKGAKTVGKWAGQVKKFISTIGQKLSRDIETTQNSNTKEYQKMASAALGDIMNSLKGKKIQEGTEDVKAMVTKIIQTVKPVLSNYLKKNDKTGIANFLAIMALTYLEKIMAPNMASGTEQPDEKVVNAEVVKFKTELNNQIQPLLK